MVDQRLAERFHRGEPDAVRALYECFGRPVFTVAYRSLADRSLAEEVVQLTFLKAWRAADRFDPSHELAPWLYAIARRTAIDVYRRESRHATSPDEPEIAVLPPSFEDLWELWEVRAAVDRLPEVERQVLEATHYGAKTMQETADDLGLPVGTVKSRSHRAHARLATLLAHVREVSA
jgi:RNA polymerase sigma-70 factor, ECF subfamily